MREVRLETHLNSSLDLRPIKDLYQPMWIV